MQRPAAVVLGVMAAIAGGPALRGAEVLRDRRALQPSEPAPSMIPLADAERDPVRSFAHTDQTVVLLVTRQQIIIDDAARAMWQDPRVQEWARRHPGVFQCVHERLPSGVGKSASLAELFGHEPAEGVYAFRRGRVFDRDSLYADPGLFLRWIAHVEAGAVPIEFARERAGERGPGAPLVPRLILGERLFREGLLREAAEEYAWVVEEVYGPWAEAWGADPPRAPALDYPRVKLYELNQFDFLGQAAALVRESPEATGRLSALRDRLLRIAGSFRPANGRMLDTALTLNWVVPSTERLRECLAALAEAEDGRQLVSEQLPEIIAAFGERGLWSEAGRVVHDPIGAVEWCWAPFQVFIAMSDAPRPQGAAAELAEMTEFRCAAESGLIYAALLAAGRDEDAAAAAEAVFRVRDTAVVRGILVSAALDAGEVRPVHREWAERARDAEQFQDGPKSLVFEVEEAMKSKTGTQK